MDIGINNNVIVIVVNNRQNIQYFDTILNNRTIAARMIHNHTKNWHKTTIIQKQAFDPQNIKTVSDAYGLTSTNFNTHSAYINGIKVDRNSKIKNGTTIVLIDNKLNIKQSIILGSKHTIISGKLQPSK